MTQLIFQSAPWVMPVLMFVVLCAAIEVPYRWRGRFLKEKIATDPFNVVQAGLLTLASFVLGLSFAQASDRFDSRRALVVKEANAIGTTWLRAGQLEPPQKVLFRRTLTDYTASRLAAYGTKRADLASGMSDPQRQAVEKQLETKIRCGPSRRTRCAPIPPISGCRC